MKIHIKKDIEVPEGFYCDGCKELKATQRDGHIKYYCTQHQSLTDLIEVKYKILKCPDCLLACRESLMEEK